MWVAVVDMRFVEMRSFKLKLGEKMEMVRCGFERGRTDGWRLETAWEFIRTVVLPKRCVRVKRVMTAEFQGHRQGSLNPKAKLRTVGFKQDGDLFAVIYFMGLSMKDRQESTTATCIIIGGCANIFAIQRDSLHVPRQTRNQGSRSKACANSLRYKSLPPVTHFISWVYLSHLEGQSRSHSLTPTTKI